MITIIENPEILYTGEIYSRGEYMGDVQIKTPCKDPQVVKLLLWNEALKTFPNQNVSVYDYWAGTENPQKAYNEGVRSWKEKNHRNPYIKDYVYEERLHYAWARGRKHRLNQIIDQWDEVVEFMNGLLYTQKQEQLREPWERQDEQK